MVLPLPSGIGVLARRLGWTREVGDRRGASTRDSDRHATRIIRVAVLEEACVAGQQYRLGNGTDVRLGTNLL